MKSFDQIALETGTDKSSRCHDYCSKYERYLPLSRDGAHTIFEIGVAQGQSLAAWRRIYENATIVGIDIDPICARFHDPGQRVHVEIGSQEDEAFLADIVAKYGPFDMILDDGSHLQHHVITSFKALWGAVKPGGVYVVEDCSTSYWHDYGGSLKGARTMVEFFKDVVDDVNFLGERQLFVEPAEARRDDGLIRQFEGRGCYGSTMESIQFLNSMIIMRKRH